MSDETQAFAETAKQLGYGFAAIAEQLGASLIKAAEDNAHEANALLDSVKILVEEIQKHVDDHAKMLADRAYQDLWRACAGCPQGVHQRGKT